MKAAAKKALTKAKSQANEALTASNKAPKEVNDGGSAEVAAEVLLKVTKARKAIDEARKDATKPSRDETDEINKEFSELLNPLKGREAALKDELNEWEEAEEKRIAEEQRKAEEETAKAQAEADIQAHEEGKDAEVLEEPEPEKVAPLRVGGGTSGGVKTWTAEIEDVAAIPHEVLVTLVQENPSAREAIEVALRAYAKKHKDKAVIPGVKFFRKRHRSSR
jgi:hypothetical protein